MMIVPDLTFYIFSPNNIDSRYAKNDLENFLEDNVDLHMLLLLPFFFFFAYCLLIICPPSALISLEETGVNEELGHNS